MQVQQDLFEQQVDSLCGEETEITFELVESEHRSDYLRFMINGTHMIDAATGLLEQARRNVQQATRVASLHRMKEEHDHSDALLYKLDKAIKETKKVL